MGMINPNADMLGVFQQLIANQQRGGGGGGGGGGGINITGDPISEFSRMQQEKLRYDKERMAYESGLLRDTREHEARIEREAAESTAARQMELINAINDAHAQKELLNLEDQQPLNDKILQLEAQLDEEQSKLTAAEVAVAKANPAAQQMLRDHEQNLQKKLDAELANRYALGDPDVAKTEEERTRMRSEVKNRRLIAWNRMTAPGGALGMAQTTLGQDITLGLYGAAEWLGSATGFGDKVKDASVAKTETMDPRAKMLAASWDGGRFGKMLDPTFDTKIPEAIRGGNDLSAEIGGEIISDALNGLGLGNAKTLETKQGVTKLLKELFGASTTTGSADQNFKRIEPILQGLSLAMFDAPNREHNVVQFISSHLKDFSSDAVESSGNLATMAGGPLTGETLQKAAQYEVQTRLGKLGNMLNSFTKNRYITDSEYSKKLSAIKAAYRPETGSFEPGMFGDTGFKEALDPAMSGQLNELLRLIEAQKTAQASVKSAEIESAKESRKQKLKTGPASVRRTMQAERQIDADTAARLRKILKP